MKVQTKNRKWLFLLLYLVSFFFTVDYFILMRGGEDSLRRKIVFTVWFLSSVIWLAFFLREILMKAKPKQTNPDKSKG
jgi:hypothetical protein